MDTTWTRTPPRGCVRPSVCPPPMIPGRLDILSIWAAIKCSASCPSTATARKEPERWESTIWPSRTTAEPRTPHPSFFATSAGRRCV